MPSLGAVDDHFYPFLASVVMVVWAVIKTPRHIVQGA
jgi:hypothetical protein